MRKLVALVFTVMWLLVPIISHAEVTIGNGFTCSGTAIMKGSKEVTFTKAKSTLNKTIMKLKQKISGAPKNKKASLKTALQTARSSKTLLSACTSGDLDSSEVDPIFSQLASGSGTYSGTYSGLVGGFIPLSGTVEIVFELDGTNFGATLGLGGNLGNTLNAQPLAFQNDVGGIGFPAQFFLQNTFIGDVTLSITAAGHLSITNSNSNTGSVIFEGDFSNSTITSSLNGSYNNISFAGTATLTRQ